MDRPSRSRKRMRASAVALLWLCGLVAAEGFRLPPTTQNLAPRTVLGAHAKKSALGRASLLTAEEEVLLAKQIQAMTALDQTRQELMSELGRTPTVEEMCSACGRDRKSLVATVTRGKHAKRAMVNANMRLVCSIAKKYKVDGAHVQDLIQEGTFGLMKAIEKFDPSKGFKFSTYATWWIRQTVVRHIHDKSRTVRLPVHMHEFLSKIKKTKLALYDEMGRHPSSKQVAQALNVPVEKVDSAQRAGMDLVSVDDPLMHGDQNRLIDMIIDEEPQANSVDSVDSDLRNLAILRLVESLPARECLIVKLRFGLGFEGDQYPYTLEQVGSTLGITRERVRQLEYRALHRMRQPYLQQKLKTHLRDNDQHGLVDNPSLSELDKIQADISKTTGEETIEMMAKLERLLRRRGDRSIEDQAAAPFIPEGVEITEEDDVDTWEMPLVGAVHSAPALSSSSSPSRSRSRRRSRGSATVSVSAPVAATATAASPATSTTADSVDDADFETKQRRALAAAATKAVAEARRNRQLSKSGMAKASATGVRQMAGDESFFSEEEGNKPVPKVKKSVAGLQRSVPVKKAVTKNSVPSKLSGRTEQVGSARMREVSR